MAYASWRVLRLPCVFHHPVAFELAPVVTTTSIQNGDAVALRAWTEPARVAWCGSIARMTG
ncbi:hypothetical protein [Burkholderia ubonensis]|uniref:hypothetical protein n=1 Tax=Burkholderia ubonensis TaxID=101571 RepID=UPI000AD87705|nr:hypothetical protein [Burkholderia ubonensis]